MIRYLIDKMTGGIDIKAYIKDMLLYPFMSSFEILGILREIKFDVYLLSSKANETNVLYITSSDINQYFVERICPNANITKIKKIYLWSLIRFIDRKDMQNIVIDMHKYLTILLLFKIKKGLGFLVPSLVRQVLYLDKSSKDIKKSIKDFNKIDKYICEISTNLDDLIFFYEKLYTPYIKKRFADSAYIENFEKLKKIFRKGELIFIKLDGKYISAALCEMRDNIYFFCKVGVLEERYVKEGTLLALYYFAISRAKEKNLRIIDFGQSRPFLSDGVLRHKRKWGTKICEDRTLDRIFYLKNACKQPFIYFDYNKNKKLKAIVFSKDDKFIKEFATSGLEFKVL